MFDLEVAERVRTLIKDSGKTSGAVAAKIGLSDSQLSKSLGGTRNFSAGELAKLADEFNVSMYWLVTGQEDPHEFHLVARHSFNSDERSYTTDGLERDHQLLSDIALIYRQAYA